MQRVTLALVAVLFTVAQAGTSSRGSQPKPPDPLSKQQQAVYFTVADRDTLLKNTVDKLKENYHQGALVVDIGEYNIGINVQHQPVPGLSRSAENLVTSHLDCTEIYYIFEGTGTFATVGGPSTDPTFSEYSKEKVRASNGQGMSGRSMYSRFKNPAQLRQVGPGDIIIVPPGVGHEFTKIDGKWVRYILFRVDPHHVLPEGFVNKYLKRPSSG